MERVFSAGHQRFKKEHPDWGGVIYAILQEVLIQNYSLKIVLWQYRQNLDFIVPNSINCSKVSVNNFKNGFDS